MASSFPSVDFCGSSTKVGSSVTKRCRSVKRTVRGSTSGYLSVSAIPRSSASSHLSSAAIRSPCQMCKRLIVVSGGFGDIVAVPGGNFDHDFARFLDYRLAAEARVQLQIGGHVEPIGLVIVHFTEQFLALPHHHVASGAGAVASAGVLQMKAEVHRNVEDRLRLAMVLVAQLAVFELKGLVVRKERQLDRG